MPHWVVGSISLNGRRHNANFGAFRRCNYPIYDEVCFWDEKVG